MNRGEHKVDEKRQLLPLDVNDEKHNKSSSDHVSTEYNFKLFSFALTTVGKGVIGVMAVFAGEEIFGLGGRTLRGIPSWFTSVKNNEGVLSVDTNSLRTNAITGAKLFALGGLCYGGGIAAKKVGQWIGKPSTVATYKRIVYGDSN